MTLLLSEHITCVRLAYSTDRQNAKNTFPQWRNQTEYYPSQWANVNSGLGLASGHGLRKQLSKLRTQSLLARAGGGHWLSSEPGLGNQACGPSPTARKMFIKLGAIILARIQVFCTLLFGSQTTETMVPKELRCPQVSHSGGRKRLKPGASQRRDLSLERDPTLFSSSGGTGDEMMGQWDHTSTRTA